MPIKITKKTRAMLEKPYWCRFWGQRRKCRPVFIEAIFGDGMQLISLTPINTRPHYYLIRVDSSWSLDNSDDLCIADNLDDIYEAIEDQVGPAHWQDDDGQWIHDPWPAASLDDGSSWAGAINLLPKRLRPKAA